MAKPAMVTRTFTTTIATVLCLNVESGEPYNRTVTLPKVFKSDEDVLKYLRSNFDTETEKVVHVVHVATEEKLYGMPEQEFINHAQVLPPRVKAE